MSSLYTSEDWKDLDLISRAQLVLVLEGLKPGTIIRGNWSSFQRIIKRTGLDYIATSNKHSVRLSAAVASSQTLAEYITQPLTPEKMKTDQHDRIRGKFLGYPVCCIEEYCRERTPEEQKAKRCKDHLHSYRFGRELDDLIKKEGAYPDILDYRPPSFTPCSISCPEASTVLTQWKEVIDKYDPQAAEEIVALNRYDDPERRVHTDFWREYRRKHEPQRMDMMRSWLRGEHNHTFEHYRRLQARKMRAVTSRTS